MHQSVILSGDITRGVIADDTAAEHLRGRSLQHIDGFM